jgi:hypothetical protein
MNSIVEGIQSLLHEERKWPDFKTDRTRPSTTMIRGQNGSIISDRISKFEMFLWIMEMTRLTIGITESLGE